MYMLYIHVHVLPRMLNCIIHAAALKHDYDIGNLGNGGNMWYQEVQGKCYHGDLMP